jgi:hypothetical protein
MPIVVGKLFEVARGRHATPSTNIAGMRERFLRKFGMMAGAQLKESWLQIVRRLGSGHSRNA